MCSIATSWGVCNVDDHSLKIITNTSLDDKLFFKYKLNTMNECYCVHWIPVFNRDPTLYLRRSMQNLAVDEAMIAWKGRVKFQHTNRLNHASMVWRSLYFVMKLVMHTALVDQHETSGCRITLPVISKITNSAESHHHTNSKVFLQISNSNSTFYFTKILSS